MARWSVLREPTVPILLAACVVHVVRRDVLDFAVFFGTSVVIIVDSRRGDGSRFDGHHGDRVVTGHWQRAWLPLIGMTMFAGVAALAGSASLADRLIVTVIGIAALVIVLFAPGSKDPRRAHRVLAGWQVWAVIGVAACLWELTSFITQQIWPLNQDAHPAISDLVGPMLVTWFPRAVFLLMWAGAGWWLLQLLLSSGASTEPGERHTRFGTWGAGHREARQ
ncbi:MAG: hypothetical protein ABI382_14235 [Nakamurella sp.]